MRRYQCLLLVLVVGQTMAASYQEGKELQEEGRGRIRRLILPFLIGLVLKAYTLVPLKLMIMTFVTLLSLIAAKIGLGLAILTGLAQHYHKHSSESSMTGYSVPIHIASGMGDLGGVSGSLGPGGTTGMANPTQNESEQQPAYVRRVHIRYK